MDLSGKCLIAMPGLADPRFEKSLVFLCAHSPEGTMGLIVNRPLPEITFRALLDRVNIAPTSDMRPLAVRYGGPVEPGRGFVLHSADYTAGSTTMRTGAGLGLTATLDVLEALARGQGPSLALFALGYAGWGPGQLEAEILRNDWLTCDAPAALVFGADDGAKWERALALLGVDALSLSATAGRA
ncbi:MAG: YqgE/AlgH family protein [Gemmobacter sp.]